MNIATVAISSTISSFRHTVSHWIAPKTMKPRLDHVLRTSYLLSRMPSDFASYQYSQYRFFDGMRKVWPFNPTALSPRSMALNELFWTWIGPYVKYSPIGTAMRNTSTSTTATRKATIRAVMRWPCTLWKRTTASCSDTSFTAMWAGPLSGAGGPMGAGAAWATARPPAGKSAGPRARPSASRAAVASMMTAPSLSFIIFDQRAEALLVVQKRSASLPDLSLELSADARSDRLCHYAARSGTGVGRPLWTLLA
mmetsp:Transcript_9793/g.29618  ORF Transcript_9793/g.29618 Transcript_9793/m.29618 type:complete len:253 (-) Transcript_9793:31-789(-)